MSSIIIDQNRFRSGELDDELHYAKPDDLFVIIDAAFIEMCKGNEYESTLNKSLAFLREHPSKVAVSASISQLMRQEIESKQPTVDIINHELTDAFRLYLEESRTLGSTGPLHSELMRRITLHQASLANEQLNVIVKRPQLEGAVIEWEQMLSPEELLSLRNSKWSDDDWLRTSGVSAAKRTTQLLIENGWSVDEAKAFTKLSPIMFRVQFAFNNLALFWLQKGGLPTAGDDKVLNDLIDLDYAVSATYATKLMTNDGKANLLFSHLKHLLEKIVS